MLILFTEIWRSWRGSLRRPGFLLLASGVLALGIGTSVAVFTLIDQVLMKPLPLPEASRVMVVGTRFDGQRIVSALQYQHMMPLKGIRSVGLTLFSRPDVNITGGGRPEVVSAAYIDRGMLPTLGLHPVLGRNFTAQEDAPHGSHVVMLGYGFWQRRYAGNPNVLGQVLDVKGTACTIVGVLPKSFGSLAFSGDIALPLALAPHSTDNGLNYIAVARLTREANPQTVAAGIDARMHAMYAAMGSSYAADWKDKRFGAQPITDWQHAEAHAVLTLFMACALFVLLTALVNLVNLMLLRALSRTHDSAVRGALGASWLRLVLPALAEGLLVGIVGALIGIGLVWIGLHWLQGAVSASWLPGDIHMKPWIAALALVVAVAVAVLATVFGIWRSQSTTASEELREGGRSGLGRRGGRLGRVLVVAQMLLATVLLCGTGLLLHGLYKVAGTPLGFSGAHTLTFALAPIRADYPDARSVNELSRRLVHQLEAIPGVTVATATTNLPSGRKHTFNTNVHRPGGKPIDMDYLGIGPAYFRLFHIPVLRGRAFTLDDVRGGEAVAVVNRALAKRMYGGHALGQLIQEDSGTGMWSARIVGVVGDTRQFGPLQTAPAIVYVPLAQIPNRNLDFIRYFMPMRFALRGHGDPDAWRAAVHAAVAQVAPDQPISDFRDMRTIVNSTMTPTRTTLLLVGVFAVLALLLAMAGMYAVMAVAVAAREREFGVRLALGAKPTQLVRLVLVGGLIQVVIGLVIGVATVLAVSRSLQQMLIALVARHDTFDPMALIGVCMVLMIAGLLACLLPALRAARVQPMHALRGE